MVPPNLQQLQVGGGGCVVVYVEQALPLAHSVSPHMHAAALNLEPSVVSHVGIATQQSDAAHVLVAHVTPVNVSFKWFFPATQEEEAKSVPVPSMSSHVGLFTSQQSDAAHVPVAHVMPVNMPFKWFFPATQE